MVTIKLFAAMAEEAGVDTLQVEWKQGMSTQDIKQLLIDKYPLLRPRVANAMAAVNQEYTPSVQELQDNDEIAFIPPVSGG
ncbi:molybdopterin converting factor subunit 1 [Aneurinibacillus sp. Ricciae_BoGa-3]|uniref:molybdopterin converting factor subunit 1 n=1 Tax=Aneurinibacillus sp. Ricciae_BoGa-3 TaxID=3022697 RepID=UPI0023416BB4|nr:molybdopterin converting factor subunit 1 [Aneurinibacillus sp. Ricciae_BoGa-3]WCK52430.1 molybdopterin converting factor subunit 1 [Aneurinibacillus sp. Ricciae_BoGa-3]